MAFVGIETEIIILACVFGFIMAWGIGANDVANAFGTSVGSGAISLKTALLIACIFEFAGAFLAGGEVTDTIRKGIIDSDQFTNNSDVLVFGMMSATFIGGNLVIRSIGFRLASINYSFNHWSHHWIYRSWPFIR